MIDIYFSKKTLKASKKCYQKLAENDIEVNFKSKNFEEEKGNFLVQ